MMWSLLEKIVKKQVVLDSKVAMVSFTFDDAPLSAFTNGGEILERYGYHGTYYISCDLIDRSTADGQMPSLDTIENFHARGHEIGNHTFDHLSCNEARFWRIVRNISQNRKMLAKMMSGNFAYPYGAVDARARVAVRFCTTSARGISFGINRNIINIMHLNAARVYAHCGIDKCLDLIEECAAEGGWLIFYTHDVCDRPSAFGCTPEQFTRLVGTVSNNNLTVATVGKALQMIKQNRWGTV